MKKFLSLLFIAVFTSYSFSQELTTENPEIGFDLAFSSSTLGGNAGIGLKYSAFQVGDVLVFGPSVRYERTWVKNSFTGVNGGYNVYGGGVFAHTRFYNAIFLGLEYEILKSPFNSNGFLTGVNSSWAHTLFLGGGFSREFNESFRINAGLMYDVINADNSPFKRSYSISQKDANGNIVKILPIIFRLAFFIRL
ncbi:MAG: hypothetical protein COA33_000980 [Fluviicola sp.]|nr:hypothetical protein [Fluviicola sp.]